jgi:hypothetical protein
MAIALCPEGHFNPHGTRFCGECGQAVKPTTLGCPSGHQNPPENKFCGECGSALDGAAANIGTTSTISDAGLSVTLENWSVLPENSDVGRYLPLLQLEYGFDNQGKRDIRAFTGTQRFLDLFDRDQLSISLTVDTRVLHAGQAVDDKSWSFELNNFIAEHNWIAARSLAEVKAPFEIENILFTDGTSLS